MNRLYLLLLLSCYALAAHSQESLDFSSESASYDGQNLFLQGAVTLISELGLMQAEQATLSKTEAHSETEFSNLKLNEKVFFSFPSGAALTCDQAELDLTAFTGTFSSSSSPVYYRDFPTETQKHLEISSQDIDFSLSKNAREGKQLQWEISSIFAKNNVHIKYANIYLLEAERARYTNSPSQQGMLEAFAITPNMFCTFTSGGHEVKAKTMHFDLNKEVLTLDKPLGEISSFLLSHGQERFCTFSSNMLFWNHQNHSLHLEKEIEIQDEYFGSVQGKDSLFIFQNEKCGKHVIQKILALGESVFTPKADPAIHLHRLTSYDTLEINRDELEVRAKSPLVHGKTPLEKQLVYEKGDFTLYADEGILNYTLKDLELKLSACNLLGHVRFKRDILYSVADSASYDPNKSQITFLANPHSNVFLWNKAKNLKVKAQKVLLFIDPETKEETIQAEGIVHFEEDDNILFKQFFPGEPKVKEKDNHDS